MNVKDKKDLKKIFQDTLIDFWDKAVEPALNKLYGRVQRVEKKVDGVRKEVKDLSQTVVKVKERVDDIGANVITHEKRLEKIEKEVHLPA